MMRLPLAVLVLGVLTAFPLASCGDDDGSAEPPPDGLTELEAEGLALVQAKGCASCHGLDGQGGVGPGWIGLAGSEVVLDDGSTVEADADYLRRALIEPNAEIRAGFAAGMPATPLTDAEVDALVAYISTL